MTNDNVKSTLRLLANILINKHPPPSPIFPDSILLKGTPSPSHDPHPVIFDAIDCQLIHCMAFRVQGAGGPSGVNAISWRHFC